MIAYVAWWVLMRQSRRDKRKSAGRARMRLDYIVARDRIEAPAWRWARREGWDALIALFLWPATTVHGDIGSTARRLLKPHYRWERRP